MKHLPVFLLGLLLLAASPSVSAAETAIADIATIVMHLNHYPSAAEKIALTKIITNPQSSAGEKTLAGALMHMQHQVGGADAEKLRALAAKGSKAARVEKELAIILLGIAHKPSGNDMQRLKALVR